MKLPTTLSLFFAYLIILLACSYESRETVSDTLDTGQKETYQIDPETKKKDGLYERFSASGTLIESSEYVQGNLHGTRTLYFPNEKPEIIEHYVQDTIHGLYTVFYENGNIYRQGKYEKGEMVHVWYTYYPEGGYKEKVTFSNNAENGPFIEYYPSGLTKAKGYYKGGDQEDGLLYLYDSLETIERVMTCSLALCHTIWTPDSTNTMPKDEWKEPQ